MCTDEVRAVIKAGIVSRRVRCAVVRYRGLGSFVGRARTTRVPGRDNFGSCASESTDPVVVVVCDANDPLDFI